MDPETRTLKPRIVLDAEGWTLATMRFYELALVHDLLHVDNRAWPTISWGDLYEDRAVLSIRSDNDRTREGIRRYDDGLVYFSVDTANEWVHVWTATRSRAAGERLLKKAQHWFPRKIVPPEERTAPFRFWSMRPSGPDHNHRRLDVCAWDEIAPNYTASAREALDRLHALDAAPDGGRLIVLHGEPGTGKTHLIRSLAWAWRRWCRFDCVLDPETMLGSRPDYLIDVLTSVDSDSRWTALVLEDTGELLRPDAGDRTGQGLARFLNVLDGLLGQGSRTLAIVTTNEELGRLHPAVVRPGRCAARVEVGALTAEESAAWLAARGVNADPGPASLAELFRIARGDVELSAVPEPVRVGFG